MNLRTHEWMFLGYFAYVAGVSPFFSTRPGLHAQPYLLLAALAAFFYTLWRLQRTRFAPGIQIARDWLPLFFLFMAFREMDYFAPRQYDLFTEMSWIRWDWIILDRLHLKQYIEAWGRLIPLYLELCYLLVYGVGAYCVAVLTIKAGRQAVNRFWNIFLLGTLGAYALFPYFPTQPPRYAFSDIAPPAFSTPLRRFNLYLLDRTTIHTGVFPSAHVSCAFAGAFALILLMPRGRFDGWWLLLYAVSVSIATVYGRYHYTVDVFAGFAVSMLSAALCFLYYAYDVKRREEKKP